MCIRDRDSHPPIVTHEEAEAVRNLMAYRVDVLHMNKSDYTKMCIRDRADGTARSGRTGKCGTDQGQTAGSIGRYPAGRRDHLFCKSGGECHTKSKKHKGKRERDTDAGYNAAPPESIRRYRGHGCSVWAVSYTHLREDLDSYFEKCCTSMRTYRTGQHQTSGTNEADNTQIVSEMYEVFAKENARAAGQANYQEGKALNEKYYSDGHSDWTYYN